MAETPRISLQDIAARANVSKATVSLALRKHPRISEATRERVLKIAKELGYRPDPELSKLMATMKRKPNEDQGTIGFIRSGLTEDWELMEKFFFDEITEAAATYGYQVEPYWIYDPRESPKRINNTMWNRGVDGLIIPMIHPDRYNQGVRTLPIDWDKFITVEIADTIQEPKINGVRYNHFGGMLQTLSELEALGYKKIGFTMESDVELRTHHRWTAAYMLWKSMRGLHECLPLHFPKKYKEKPLLDWIEKAQLEVIISPGVEVYKILKDNKLSIPKEIAFATLHQWGDDSTEVTGINQNMPAQARIAVDMLVGLIHRRVKDVPKNPILAMAVGYWSAGTTTRRAKRGHKVHPLNN